jgi:diguanylate cyclase (GGDEF)-like protein
MSPEASLGLLSVPQRVLVRAWVGAAAAGFVVLVAHLGVGFGGHGLDTFADRWLYDGLELLAATALFLRAAWVPGERVAWAVLGLALLSFSVGDLCFDFVYGGNPPTPSAADPFYLAFYPGCYAALLLLVRSRISTFSPSVWLDGMIAAFAGSAVAAAVVFQIVLDHTSGRALTVIVDLAYPLGDVLLLGLALFVFAVTGWRPGREWATIGAAFLAIMFADSLFLDLNAAGGYAEGTLLDALWPASLLLLAASAWQPQKRRHTVDLEGRFLGAVPIGCGFVALAVLIDDYFSHLNLLAVGLAAATITTVFFRTALSFNDNARLLKKTREQSLSDVLTRLGNRRKLMFDLQRELRDETPEPLLLVILDLNGFKAYNDTFGHPSGDALLARLAGKLAVAAGPLGRAYRLGGDEFCILAPFSSEDAATTIHAATEALSEGGDGFSVTASFGAAVLPEEAADVSNALRVADKRLYAQKATLHRARGEHYEVLLRALFEREPSLREHLHGVAELAVSVGTRLDLADPALNELKLAAELHDVGKLAIPDALLRKPGPLDREEQEFMQQHTVIGQRILAGSPALQGIGHIVRSTHERWDGDGYVDGLVGVMIPQAARIIAICDAYASMTSDRSYRPGMAPAEALAELRRCAGTQFDPDLVREFCEMMLEPNAPTGDEAALAQAAAEPS